MTTYANPLALLVVMLAWAAFGVRLLQVIRRRRAETAPERRDLGSWLGIVLQGVAIGIVFFGPIYPLPKWFDVPALATAALPIVFALTGLWLFDRALRELGQNWSVVARVREDHALVTSGPFALVRNPIYLAMFLMMIAAGIALGHVVHLTVAVPLFILATAMRVAREERLLREQFGAAYDDYANRVARLVPGVW